MAGRITFLGAAGTVTGSKYLLEVAGNGRVCRVLVDAGIFQGDRAWREKNWEDLACLAPGQIDACLLTHAHIDHTGFLPRLYRMGLRCPVYGTAPTLELTKILLLDSAAIQEEEAAYRAKERLSRHNPPLPLYSTEDARQCLALLRPVPFGHAVEVCEGVRAEWRRMGHILGAASIAIKAGPDTVTFSGDIGRPNVPILRDPEPQELGSLLVVESTYGDRDHGVDDQKKGLASIINRTAARGGVLLVPSFAVGRAQTLLYQIRELKERRQIPDLPVVIDSPMAEDATALYVKFPSDYDEEALRACQGGRRPFSFSKLFFARTRDDSKRLNEIDEPMIIISASGMLSGGRIIHHLARRIGDPRNAVLFVGHQPAGGKGDLLLRGARTILLFKREFQVRAEIEELTGASAHAGRSELLQWCRSCGGHPAAVAVVHGEPSASRSFLAALERELGWKGFVAAYRQTFQF